MKSHWNYRVIKQEVVGKSFPPFTKYSINEVYYTDDKPNAYAEEDIWAESIEELKEILTTMLKALDAPVIEHKDIGKLE